MRRLRTHLATSQFLVVVNPDTNLPAGILQDGRQYIVGFTNVSIAERFFPPEAGRPLVGSMRQVLKQLGPEQYLLIDPTEPDPIVVKPGVDRGTLFELSNPFPPLARMALSEPPATASTYLSALRERVSETGKPVTVHAAVTQHKDGDPWLTLMIDSDPEDFTRVSDLAITLCDEVDPSMWVNTAFARGKALPRSARAWVKRHEPIVSSSCENVVDDTAHA
jgi:hypothetical protein